MRIKLDILNNFFSYILYGIINRKKKYFFGIYLGLAGTIMKKSEDREQLNPYNLYYGKMNDLKYLEKIPEKLPADYKLIDGK